MAAFSHHDAFVIVSLALSTGLILGHNLWVIASGKERLPGESLRLEINTSDLFPLSESAVAPERIESFTLMTADGEAPVTAFKAEGASLVAEIAAPHGGMLLAALTLHPRLITLEAEKFLHYLQEEEAEAVIAAREQSGQCDRPGREVYAKYAKTIVQTGQQGGDAFNRIAGQRLEIVPEKNPAALRVGDWLPVRVLFDGLPANALRVSTGCDGLNNGVYLAHRRTDAEGRTAVEITAPGRWFVRTHFIQAHNDPATAEWESFWSSLAFSVGY